MGRLKKKADAVPGERKKAFEEGRNRTFAIAAAFATDFLF
jgi:hypothetical protein